MSSSAGFLFPLQVISAVNEIGYGIGALTKDPKKSETFVDSSNTSIIPAEWNWENMTDGMKVFMLIIMFVILIAVFAVFVRLVFYAFKVQGPLQGVFALVTPQLYVGWNFASLIQKNFEAKGFAGFFK